MTRDILSPPHRRRLWWHCRILWLGYWVGLPLGGLASLALWVWLLTLIFNS